MSAADAGTMIEELRAAFPALEWKWIRYLTFAEGGLISNRHLMSVRIVVQEQGGQYRAEVSRFSVSVGFEADTLPGLVEQLRYHLLTVAHFYQRIARRFPGAGEEE